MLILMKGVRSMARKRRTFAPEFKAQVILELLRGEKTMAQLCREHNLGHDLLGQWQDTFLARAPQLFGEPPALPSATTRIAELERLAGQQALELAILKKVTAWKTSPARSSGT